MFVPVAVEFQYISCYGLSYERLSNEILGKISIHLMLRFIFLDFWHKTWYNNISIHLMLRFIGKEIYTKTFTRDISIHLMLRFIKEIFGEVEEA